MNDSHGIFEQTMKWIALYLPSVYAGLCALGISALIDIRAGKPKLYTATGALICGIFALAVSALLEYWGCLRTQVRSLVRWWGLLERTDYATWLSPSLRDAPE